MASERCPRFRQGAPLVSSQATPTRTHARRARADVFVIQLNDGGRSGSAAARRQRDAAARDAAGWTVCLDALEAALDGSPTRALGSQPTDAWRARDDAYVSSGMPSGAPVPSPG